MTPAELPVAQGLYDPRYEHDACGVGFVADLKNRQSHDIIRKAIQVLLNDTTFTPERMQQVCMDVASKLIGFSMEPAPA